MSDENPNIDPALRADLLEGLSSTPRALHCKYFYDERGSRLFEEITRTEEYYPTRTEIGILERSLGSIADAIGPGANIVEFGSGSGRKTELLLAGLREPRSYKPVEISQSALDESVASLRERFPEIAIEPLRADYTRPLEVELPEGRRIVFFPGSTIGNFTRDEAKRFMSRAASFVGAGGGLLIGVDLKKDPSVLHAAYNDAAGVTEAFNLNLLRRLNREADADFNLEGWRHYAYYAPIPGRIEVYLVSLRDQTVSVGDARFEFEVGDAIHTENSHKYTRGEFEALGRAAGFEPRAFWSDPNDWFGIFYFTAL